MSVSRAERSEGPVELVLSGQRVTNLTDDKVRSLIKALLGASKDEYLILCHNLEKDIYGHPDTIAAVADFLSISGGQAKLFILVETAHEADWVAAHPLISRLREDLGVGLFLRFLNPDCRYEHSHNFQIGDGRRIRYEPDRTSHFANGFVVATDEERVLATALRTEFLRLWADSVRFRTDAPERIMVTATPLSGGGFVFGSDDVKSLYLKVRDLGVAGPMVEEMLASLVESRFDRRDMRYEVREVGAADKPAAAGVRYFEAVCRDKGTVRVLPKGRL